MVIDNAEMVNKAAGAAVNDTHGPMSETVKTHGETLGESADAKPQAVAKIQVLNGTFAGREVLLNKAVTTLGRPGVQVIAITRRANGYNIIKVENAEGREAPSVNGEPLEDQARRLKDNDVIQIIGIKMGFFAD
jgi:hypothetical protein